jgi:inner membrane protein
MTVAHPPPLDRIQGLIMDPLSQATIGAAAAQSLNKQADLARIGLIGALAGMAPDLDVLIQSSTDPLLQLEYHRQFTHSLAFIPLGAFLCAIAFWPFVRRHMSFKTLWLSVLAGYATHGLLDACTTYGTLLLWPFSDRRIAWNTISVVDPLFTLPLLGFVIAAVVKKSQPMGRLGLAWVAFYLSIGVIQEERARAAGEALSAHRGHAPADVSAKPSFGNLLLWKTVYEYDDQFWVDAVRAGGSVSIIEGDHVKRLDLAAAFPWLDPKSQQSRDVERFRWFSNDYLAIDRNDPLFVVDMRYSHLPNEIKGLWGIRLDPDAPIDQHVTWIARRGAD